MGRVIGDVMVLFEFCATSVIESKTHRFSSEISKIRILSECLCVIRVTEESSAEKSFISGGVVSTAATRCTTARCAIILDLSTIDQPQQQQHRVFQFTIDGLLVHPI